MARNHTHLFSDGDIEIARICKALAHPARVQIMRVLAERESCVCGDIVEDIPLAQATVSQHLKELKEAGLVQGTIDGPRVCYCIDAEGWNKAKELLNGIVALEPVNCC